MQFHTDVLIVFAEKDNEAQKPAEGWVSRFQKHLQLMLQQVGGGKKYTIALKSSADPLSFSAPANIGILVAILSKEFILSENAGAVESFYKTIASSSKTKNRIYKVFREPLTRQDQPPRLRPVSGYALYQGDPDLTEAGEYGEYLSKEADHLYWMKMVDLAYEIHGTLTDLKDGSTKTEIKKNFNRKTIYLAETGYDLAVQRSIIKRELERYGYSILPNQALPDNIGDLEKMIKKDLAQSNLSIHLIGNIYGDILPGTNWSVVDIQNKLAGEKSVKAGEVNEEFTRLIWISPSVSNANERQKSFVENIRRDVETQEGAEILQTPLEDFKNLMLEELVDAGERKHPEESSERSIYLMHDRVDANEVKPIRVALEQSGFKVLVPQFGGELLEVRKNHINNLKTFDAAIIYKGKVNEQWVRMKALDLLKAPGFGRKKPIIGQAIFTTPGSALNMENFRHQNLLVFEGDPFHPAEALKTFIQKLKT